jgi:beta-phosphoglucomutase-like phosphatase (HAD superfamily)
MAAGSAKPSCDFWYPKHVAGPAFAVIFDMDGVILDTEPINIRAWMAAAADVGYALTEEHCHDMIGLGMRESMDYLKAHVSGQGDLDQLVATANANYSALSERDGASCKIGFWELLEFLERERIPKAIATSTLTEPAREKLRRSGVLAHFDIVVGGDQVSRGKPAPDIYLLAAERLEQSPSRCVVLEDSGPGLRAAVAAGMKPIFIPDLCRVDMETQRLAFAKAGSLRDTIPLLQQASWLT